MSQRNRIATAAIVLSAALALASPPPTHAAGLRPRSLPGITAWGRVWHWLAELLPPGVTPKPVDGMEKEGSMVNPDGHAGVAPASTTNQGSMIGPDGHQ